MVLATWNGIVSGNHETKSYQNALQSNSVTKTFYWITLTKLRIWSHDHIFKFSAAFEKLLDELNSEKNIFWAFLLKFLTYKFEISLAVNWERQRQKQ